MRKAIVYRCIRKRKELGSIVEGLGLMCMRNSKQGTVVTVLINITQETVATMCKTISITTTKRI